MKFRPLGGPRGRPPASREEQKTAGGIIIPETAQEKPQEGEIIAVGAGAALDDNGKRVVPEVKTGRFSCCSANGSGTEVKIDGEDLLIMKEIRHHGHRRGGARLPRRAA